MSSRPLWLLAALSLTSCSGPETSTEPPGEFFPGTPSELGGGTFAFLPPLTDILLPPNSQSDGSLHPNVYICPTSEEQCDATSALASFTRTDGNSNEQLTVPSHGEFFEVEWQTSGSSVQAGDSFRVHVSVLGLELGTLDFALTESGGALPAGGAAVVRFYADTLALRTAAGCLPGTGVTIDCDVIQVLTAEGDSATVFDTDGSLAGRVVIPAGLANQDHLLQLQHISTAPAPPAQVPTADQYPFHLAVTTTSADGSPVTIGGSGARLILCQDAAIEQTLPQASQDQLEILRVDGTTLQRMPTNTGTPECSLTGPSPSPSQAAGFDAHAAGLYAHAAWSNLMHLFAPTPLRALHGGLNTSTGGFSEFTALLGPNGAASTASAQQGGLATPTVVTVQARTAIALPFPLGGDTVALQVAGANATSVTATHSGGGLYQLSYTPLSGGADTLFVTLNGQPVGSGPIVIQNQSTVTHLVEVVTRIASIATPGIRVVVDGPVHRELVTDSTGEARFADLPSGTYNISVAGGVPAGSVVLPSNPQVVDLPASGHTARGMGFDIQVPG